MMIMMVVMMMILTKMMMMIRMMIMMIRTELKMLSENKIGDMFSTPNPLKAHLVSGRSVFRHQAVTLNRRCASHQTSLITIANITIAITTNTITNITIGLPRPPFLLSSQ